MQTPVTNHVFSSTEATRRRQSTYDPQYGSHHNGLGESISFPPSPTGSAETSYHTGVYTSFGTASPLPTYSTHGHHDRNGWEGLSDASVPRTSSTYVHDSTYHVYPRQNTLRTDDYYEAFDMRGGRTALMTPPATPNPNFARTFTASLPSGYPYRRDARPHHSSTSPRLENSATGTKTKQARCDWAGGCGTMLDDASPSGIARHLRSHHEVPVSDNHTREMCRWGDRGCGKDMFPSSFGKHIAECHLRNMTKQCPYCGADFARADTLSRHIKGFCHSAQQGQQGQQNQQQQQQHALVHANTHANAISSASG